MRTETPAKPVITVHGERPTHKHLCPDGPHEWDCNSPYCVNIKSRCQEHDGLAPIVEGYEPWKGR